MQTAPNTTRYLYTKRGATSAILLNDCRVFDTLADTIEHAQTAGWGRIFEVSNDKRPKEIKDWYE